MSFVKQNLFFILCAVVGVASLAHMIYRISQMKRVDQEMQAVVSLSNSIAQVSREPVNPSGIQAQRERIKLVSDYHAKVVDHFYQRFVRKPLLPGLLPDPPPGRTGREMRYDFQIKYLEAMHNFMTLLGAGAEVTQADIEHTEGYLRKKVMEAEQFGNPLPGVGTPPPPPPSGRGTGRGALPGAPKGARSALPDLPELPQVTGPENAAEYWTVLQQQAALDPEMLTTIGQARQIRCYANPSPIGGSFDYHPIYAVEQKEPNMDKIWFAHLRWWLQGDLVKALSNVNQQAARALPEGEDAWVGNMPVKDILSIRVSSYIRDQNEDTKGAGRPNDSDPITDPYDTFTNKASRPLYDVINIRLRLAVDVRDLPKILNELCKDNYYVLLNINYAAYERKPPHEQFRDKKIYGPEPVVIATIDLQNYLFYKNYVPLMPQVVREALGIKEADFEKLRAELYPPEPENQPQENEQQPEAEEEDGNA